MRQVRTRSLAWPTVLAAEILVLAATARGQEPVPPTGPQPVAGHPRGGPIRRWARHSKQTLHDAFTGYPELFNEPPLGYNLYQTFSTMTAKADGHDFMLYRSDFIDGTATLSPGGVVRLNRMAARMPRWLGPVVVEWTPEQPALGEARKAGVLAQLQGAGLPVVPERILIGPSYDIGSGGTEAANHYIVHLERDAVAGSGGRFSTSPTTTATFSGGPR